MPSSTSVPSARSKTKKAAASPSISVPRSPTPQHSSLPSRGTDGCRDGSVTSSPNPAPAVLLSVEELQRTPDNRLLSYLVDTYNAVRVMACRPLLSSPSPSLVVGGAVAAPPPPQNPTTPFTPAYVEELLTPRLLCSAIPDVSQLVACLLCDAVRLHHPQKHQQQQHIFAGPDSLSSPTNTSSSTAAPSSPGRAMGSQHQMESDVAAGVAPLPFPSTRCADVLHCITHVFAELFPATASPPSSTVVAAAPPPLPLKRVAYLVERAAASHIFRYLLPHCPCASADTQRALQCVFDAVRCTTATNSASTTSAATCNEMAQLLTDILASTHDITSAQLTPLLEELAGASAALHHTSKALTSTTPRNGRGSFGSNANGDVRGGLSRSPRLQGGALITARVLLEQSDVALQPAIAAWATTEFEEGVEELLAAASAQENKEEVADVDDDGNEGDGDPINQLLVDDEQQQQQEQQYRQRTRGSASLRSSELQVARRRGALRKVARVLEVVVALTELNVDLVDQVLPLLAPHLEHSNADLRLLLLRGFGAVFAAHETAVSTYKSIFMGPLLLRFMDVKPNIRVEALRVSTMLLTQCAVRSSSTESVAGEEGVRCAAQQQMLWTAFQPCWERLLTDPHVLVRKQAVCAVTEAALASPLLLERQPQWKQRTLPSSLKRPSSLQPHAGATELPTPATFLALTLGLRARDKNRRVRDAAVDGLTKLYHAYWLSWVPNAVLDSIRVEASAAAAGGSARQSGTATHATTTSAAALPPPPAEAVVESLLLVPSSSSSSLAQLSARADTSGEQPTLMRWMGSSSKPNVALFDFERADHDDDDATHVRQKDTVTRDEGERGRWDEGDALLGLKSSATAATVENKRGRHTESFATTTTTTNTSVFVDGLLHLCQGVDTAHFSQLLRLAEKKPQLRLTVQKLLENHAAMKASGGDVKSAEGQQRIHAIHRLLSFLQETTGAHKGEWDALFRAKDDTVRKAFLRVCNPAHLDWADARETLLRSLQGRVGAAEFSFVKNVLTPQLLLPTRSDHVEELLRRLHRSIYVSEHAEVVVDAPEAVAVLRALLFITAGAPSYCQLTASGLAEALQAAARQSTAPPPAWCALLLQALQQWATAAAGAASAATTASRPLIAAPVASPSQRHDLVHALRSMAVAALPMQQVSVKVGTTGKTKATVSASVVVGSPSSSLVSLKQLAKQATHTLLALLQVPGFEKDAVAALQSLVSELTHQLMDGRALTNDAKTVAWLASVRVLSANPRAGAALRTAGTSETPMTMSDAGEALHRTPTLLPHLRSLLLTAVADVSNTTEQARVAKPQNTAATVPPSAAAESWEESPAAVSPATFVSLTSTMSVAAAIVDGAAKAMTRLALNCPTASNTRAAAVTYAMESFLQGYKATATLVCGRAGTLSIGSCQRRLAIEKQLVKLLAAPTPDLAKEMAAAVVLSVEEEVQVREVVQNKLASLLLQRSCDMRVAALLLLTAIAEDTKSSYQRLRGLVESVGDHLRAKQTREGVSLSSPAALYCYWEYAIPFIVLFLAHHPYYASEEAETQFMCFQRVWHLLVGELFRHGTQCAGFVVELLGKIKQSDDVLDPSSNATRVICDLGSRVLLECLGQRQSRAEDLRRYPGAILLPSFFVRTAQASPQKLLETVFLDNSVRVAPNAPFRLASATLASTTAAAMGSRGSSRQATPRASSPATTTLDDPSENTISAQQQQQRTPSTQRKRQRSPSVEVAAPDDSPAVSLSPSIPPVDDSRKDAASRYASPATRSSSSSSQQQQQQRARTEPALADSAETPCSSPAHCTSGTASTPASDNDVVDAGKREAAQKAAVDGALRELFSGLTKAQIAQLRWKVVRARLEEALQAADTSLEAQRQRTKASSSPSLSKTSPLAAAESTLESLMQYAKDQMRVWYNDAPA
jgi:hypothetical protein